MKIYLVTAEHFSVPGLINKPFATMEGATAEAVALANIMLEDSSRAADATADNWEARMLDLQDYHGAAHCFVEITPADLGA